MACVRRAGLDLVRRAFSKIQLRSQEWSSASSEWYQNLGSTSLKTFQNGKSCLRYHELLLSHKFYLTDSSPREDKEEEDHLPELSKTDETPEKKKWELLDAAREICQILEQGNGDTEALTQLGVQLTPRLVKMVLDKTFSLSSVLRFLQWAKTQPRFEDDNSTYDKTDEAPEKRKWKMAEARREICQIVEKGDEDMEAALTQLGVQVTPRLLNLVFAKINAPTSALRFFQWAKLQPGFKHFTSMYNRLTDILGCSKDFEALLRILSEGAAVSCKTFSAKTFSFATAWHDDPDLLNELMEMFDKLDPSFRRYAYEMLIVAFCEENHINAALVALEKMARSGCATRMQTYRPLLQVYSKNNQMGHVYEFFGRMKECPRDSICYHVVLSALLKRKQFEEAVEFLRRMDNMGYKPDAIAYGIMIKAVCNLGRIENALRLFDRMKEEGITPSPFTYRHILDVVLQIRGFDEAHSFLIQHSGKDPKLDLSNYRCLIRACKKLGQEQGARNLMIEIQAKGFVWIGKEKLFKEATGCCSNTLI